MRVTPQPELAVVTGTSFALLLALSGASAGPRRIVLPEELAAAISDVGDDVGEVWLNLLGIALDAGPPYSSERLLEALAAIDELELRRHLLGRYAWSWCTLAGVDDIEAAAGGDRAAAGRLLEHPRYYGGHAPDSLAVLIGLDPKETKARIRRAVEAGAQSLLDEAAAVALDAAGRTAAAAIDALQPLAAIERVALGYRYLPEPEANRVLLVPHLDPELQLVLLQHRSDRLIAYRARSEPEAEERLVAVGRALADPKRIEILALLGQGVVRATDLVEETGLSRSTVHYHLSQLRDAGLVALEGNARAYAYQPRPDAATAVASLLADLIGPSGVR